MSLPYDLPFVYYMTCINDVSLPSSNTLYLRLKLVWLMALAFDWFGMRRLE